MRRRRSRVSSYSATVAAIAAFSESVAIGIVRDALAGARATSRGSPSRSAPTSSVSVGAVAAARAAARRRRRRARSRSPGSSRDVADARERHGEDRAHAGAHRLRRVRVGAVGAERDAARRRRPAAERSTVPTLPGSRDAVQVHAQRPRGRRSSAARRRRSRACRSRASRPLASAARSTSWKSVAAELRSRPAR